MARLITGLAVGGAYALVAVAIVFAYRTTRILSLAMGEIGAFGLYVGLAWHTDGLPFVGGHIPPFVAGLVAVAVGGLLALVLQRLVLRHLVGRPALDGLIATLGIALSLALTELLLFGKELKYAPSPVGTGRIEVLGATLPAPRVAALLLALATAGGLALLLTRTRIGLAARGSASDPAVARRLGVPVQRVQPLCWLVAGALAGAAAALLAPTFGSLAPFAQTHFSLRSLAGAVIGGLDSVWGAVLGCLAVGVVEEVVKSQVSSAGASDVAVLVLVVGVLLARPDGLVGSPRVA